MASKSTTFYKFKADLKDLDRLNLKLKQTTGLLAQLKTGTAAYNSQLKIMNTQMGQVSAGAARMRSSMATLNKTGNKMIGIFKSASIAIVSAFAFRAIIGSLRGVIKTFSDFQSQMAAVKAISGATEDEFKKLTTAALKLGKTTVFTATQVAKLQEEYARLGFTSKEILLAQEGTLALAAGTGESLASSAQTAGSVLRAFGIDAAQTGRVADIMGAAFTNSALNLERFTQSMKFVAPVARAAGFTLEETASQMMILANNGLHGSLAGNALKNIFLRLGDANSKLNKHLGRTVQGLPQMIEALKQMKDESFGLTEATELLDKRSAPAFLTLINNIEGLESSLGILNDAEGVISEMAQIRLNTLEGDFTLLKSATEGLGVAVGEVFNVGLRQAVNTFTKWIQAISGNTSTMNNLKILFHIISTAIKVMIIRLAVLKTVSLLAAASTFSMSASWKTYTASIRTAMVGTTMMSRALQFLKAALVSTGVGALIVLLGTLVSLFMDMGDEIGQVTMQADRMSDALRKEIDNTIESTAGTMARSAALRKLRQDYPELLRHYDVEMMKTKDLIELNKMLTETEQLRMDIAGLDDMINGLSDENKQKLRTLDIDARVYRLAFDRKELSESAFESKMSGIEEERREIRNTRKEYTTSHVLVMKQMQDELDTKMKATSLLAKFRVLEGETTRLVLRDHYKEDLEAFRKLKRDKQKAEVEATEKILEKLKKVQLGRELLLAKQGFLMQNDAIMTEKADAALTKFMATMNSKELKAWSEENTKWLSQGELLNVTIDEMETKVTNFSAALERSGDATKKSALSADKLISTKNQWKKLIDMQVKNVQELEERELAAIQKTYLFKVIKNAEELALMKTNETDIKAQMKGTHKDQEKIDMIWLKKNAKKYDVLKTLTVEKWALVNEATAEGQAERTRLMGEMLKEEEVKIKTAEDIATAALVEYDRTVETLEISQDARHLEAGQKKLEAGWDQQSQGLINFFKVNKAKVKNAKENSKELLDLNKRRYKNGEITQQEYAANEIAIKAATNEELNDLEDARLAKIKDTYDQAMAIVMEFAQNQADFQIMKINEQFEREDADRENKFQRDLELGEQAGADTAAMQKAHDDYMLGQEIIKDEKILKIQRRMFILQKANDVASAIINGAVAITKVSSQTGVAAIVAAPIMSALIAAQIGMILSKKFTGAKGGIIPGGDDRFADGGMVHGPSHSNGGVKFAVGGRVAELEGGEAVINKRSTAMFRDQLSIMNAAGGGVKFAQGGLTPGTQAALDGAKGSWTANDIANLISGSINSQQVFVTEAEITSTQSSVEIQETVSSLF